MAIAADAHWSLLASPARRPGRAGGAGRDPHPRPRQRGQTTLTSASATTDPPSHPRPERQVIATGDPSQ
jgi:hypothetical protein